MHDTRIDITPVVVDADPKTVADRADMVRRLNNLGQISATDGAVNTQEQAGWQVTVNGGPAVPLTDFAVSPAEPGGQALVSLVIPADAVTVGRQPAVQPATAMPEKPRTVGTWGQPGVPDPREGIPGWEPERSGGLPRNVVVSGLDGHDHDAAHWTCGCDPTLVGIQEAARTGHISLREIRL